MALFVFLLVITRFRSVLILQICFHTHHLNFTKSLVKIAVFASTKYTKDEVPTTMRSSFLIIYTLNSLNPFIDLKDEILSFENGYNSGAFVHLTLPVSSQSHRHPRAIQQVARGILVRRPGWHDRSPRRRICPGRHDRIPARHARIPARHDRIQARHDCCRAWVGVFCCTSGWHAGAVCVVVF